MASLWNLLAEILTPFHAFPLGNCVDMLPESCVWDWHLFTKQNLSSNPSLFNSKCFACPKTLAKTVIELGVSGEELQKSL